MRRLILLLTLLLVATAFANAEAYPAYHDELAQWGFINASGEWRAVPEIADAEEVFTPHAGVCDTDPSDTLWYDVVYDRVWRWEDGWYLDSWTDKTIVAMDVQDERFGLWDRAADAWRIEPGELDCLTYYTYFNDGAAIVPWGENGGWAFILEEDGRVIPWPENLAPVDFYVDGGVALVMDEQERVGYLSINGDMLIEPQFEGAGFFCGELAVVTLTSGANALINREGRVVAELDEPVSVIPCGEWADGGIALKGDGCWLVINPDGTVRFRHPFESMQDGKFVLTHAPTAEDGPWWVLYSWGAGGAYAGLMSAEGEWLVQPEIYLPYSEIDGDALQRFEQYDLYGYVNGFGETVIPCQFAYAEPFVGDLARVTWPDGREGYIDREGRAVYTWNNPEKRDYTGMGLYPACCHETGLWGCIDAQGNWVIAPEWEYGSAYSGYAWMSNGGGFDTTGTFYAPDGTALLEGVEWVVQDEIGGLLEISTADSLVWYDTQEQRLWENPDWRELFSATDAGDKLLVFTWDGLTGIVDRKSGEWLIAPRLMSPELYFTSGAAAAQLAEGWAILHEADMTFTPFPEDVQTVVWADFVDGLLPVVDAQGLWGYLDVQGHIAIAPQFAEAEAFEAGYAHVTLQNGHDALIDTTGRIVAEAEKCVCGLWTDGAVAVQDASGWQVVNADGTVRFRCDYADEGYVTVFTWGAADVFWVLMEEYGGNTYIGVIRPDGTWIQETAWFVTDSWLVADDLTPLGSMENDLIGYVDASGAVVIPFMFYYAEPFMGDLARVEWPDGREGYIDRSGNQVYAWMD